VASSSNAHSLAFWKQDKENLWIGTRVERLKFLRRQESKHKILWQKEEA